VAERTPPIFLQGGSHSAENARNQFGLLVASGGIVAATDMAVTAPGGTMTVSVAAGDVLLKGSRTRQGVYHCINDAAVSKTIAASDPTNPRYDRIVAEVRDAAYAGAFNDWRISVVQGVAAASPAEPAIPADSIELARITVGAAVTSISGANILDRRALAVGSSSLFLAPGLIDAKGDLIVGSADNVAIRKAVGSDGTVMTADAASAGGVKWGSPVLTSSSADLGSSVAMTNANQFYDGVTISLAAGTWFIVATCTVNDATGTGGNTTFKLWDGTTAVSSTAATEVTSGVQTATLAGVVVLGGTTTYKMSAASTQAGHQIVAAAPQNGAGNNANHITAVKIG
jgi:hypothetical protein